MEGLTLDNTFHFDCGESKLYFNVVKFQNIMTRTVNKDKKQKKTNKIVATFNFLTSFDNEMV